MITFWAESLSEDQVLTRIDQSTAPSWQVSSANRIDVQTALLQKLSITAPERALKFALARDEQESTWMVSVIFGIWASTNLNAAIVAAKELDDHFVRTALSALLNSRDDLPLDRQREIARELGSENVAFLNYFERITRSPIKNPKDTWFEIVDLVSQEDIQRISRNTLVRVGVSWVKEEEMAALDEMRTSLPDDFNSTSIFSKIIGDLSEHSPHDTFDYVINVFGDQANSLIRYSSLLSKWVGRNPIDMISTISTLPVNDLRHQLLKRATSEWTEFKPRQCLENLELIPLPYRLEASRSSIRVIARTSPTEAAEHVLNMTGEEPRLWSAVTLVQQWSDQDVDGAVEWVLDLPDEDPMRTELIESLARRLLYTDIEVAFQLALEQPFIEERSYPFVTTSLESILLHSVTRYDLDLAIELLPQIRDVGYSKVSAYATIGNSLIENGEAARAMSLANELSPEQRAKYFYQVAQSRAMRDPNGLLEVFDDFPNELKSKIALTIRVTNRAARMLSQEDIARLESHITAEEIVLLDELKEIFKTNLPPETKDDLRAEKLHELFAW